MSGSGVLGRELKKPINSLNLIIIENNFQFCFRIIDNLFMEPMFRYKFNYI